MDALTAGAVGEIHLAGYHAGADLVVDDHGSRVHAPVWQVYRHAVQRLGLVPALVEWDTDLPSFDVLMAQAREADRLLQLALASPARDRLAGAAA